MSRSIIASHLVSVTASRHVAQTRAAESLWLLNSRCALLPRVIFSQPITGSLTRTLLASQDHAGPQADRVDYCICIPSIKINYFHQSIMEDYSIRLQSFW